MNSTVFSQAQITYALVAQELKDPGLQRHRWAHENSSVIWSAMSSPCWSLPHPLTSSPSQHEAQPGQHDLFQDDTAHRAPLPAPIQSKSSADEPLSHANHESGRNPRKTSPAGYEPKELATSKGTWGMVLLIVRGLLRRPSLSGSPTVTLCTVHIHNVVAKKRDASAELLQRLHGYEREHNVDFIGGDFNMSAFSTVGDVFTDAEFSARGNSLLWGLGALEEPNRECAGFLIMPRLPYEWRVHSHGCYKFDNATIGLGPRDQSAHLPVFLHLRTTNLPGPSVVRSEQAQQRRIERRHNKERMQRGRS